MFEADIIILLEQILGTTGIVYTVLAPSRQGEKHKSVTPCWRILMLCSPRACGAGMDFMSDYAATPSLLGDVRLKNSNYGTAVAWRVDGRLHK
ncbi:hypothetical protein VTI74DRAFT_10181 [Chaetomium olivicolor]